MIKNMPLSEQPREKMLRQGPHYLSNAELIAILLRTGTKEQSAIELAQSLIDSCNNGIEDLFDKSLKELTLIKGIGPSKACEILAALEISRRAFVGIPDKKVYRVTSPESLYEYFKVKLFNEKVEKFIAVFLNSKNEIITWEVISVGTLNASIVHPREVYNKAIRNNSASLIVLHNHPSGHPEPSREDGLVTTRLEEAGNIIGIKLLDHIIIGQKGYYSFKESSDLIN